ncbi:MAG TPA: methyltransferase domain-containing protein [Methanoregula sp.]|nr:methyltransferase domain-containing protein [Methanoregula sp.]
MIKTKTDKIRQHYDNVADTYDHHYDHRRGKKYHAHLSKHLMKALPENGNLLDIGCGTGLFVEKYIKTGGKGTGLDISEKMVAKARNRCPGCEFIIGTGEKLPFNDSSFNAVSSVLVFSYVRDPVAMLSEVYRVLEPKGSVALCTLGKKLITKGIPSLYKLGEKIKIKHVVMKDFGEHYYDEKEMYSLFDSAGFSDVDVKWCSFAHIDMIDPIFSLATRVEPFVEKSVPQLAYNIFVSAKKD